MAPPLYPWTGEELTAETFAAAYEPALREGDQGRRWLLDAQAEKSPELRALRERIVDAFVLSQPPREIVDAREVLTGRIEVRGARVTHAPRRLRTPRLPEGGEARRRALVRLLAPRADFDAATREAQEAAHAPR